ncbi:MAG: hypothetical protein H6733_01030 [Alphaproteobacteria bacterium]|nr:hypothetical protein [Alphaproteobacteria bacterium]
MLALFLALSTSALAADPAGDLGGVRGYAGLEWRPLSRQDLVFVDESRTSGTAVGEFDGTVRPVLGAFGGVWFNRYVALQLGLGVASLTTTSHTEDSYRQVSTAVVRPALDLRFGWMLPTHRYPVPWVILGGYADLPAARDVSDAYTDEEQQVADDAAAETRYRLGGVGGRVGLGADYRVLPSLLIGAQVTVGVHQATYTGGDQRFASTWITTEGSLLFTFEWPRRARPPEDG